LLNVIIVKIMDIETTLVSPFRVVIIGGFPTTTPKLDRTVPLVITLMVKEFSDIAPKDYDSNEEIMSDHIEESTTPMSLEVTLVTTKFIDVSPKDNTPILSEVTLAITELVDVLSEDLPDKLSPTRVDWHAIKLVSGASLFKLPHHRIDPVKHIELERQLDELSLVIKQLCLVPINIHYYEDKFWRYLVTKDVDQIRDATIYDRPMSDSSMNADMEASYIL